MARDICLLVLVFSASSLPIKWSVILGNSYEGGLGCISKNVGFSHAYFIYGAGGALWLSPYPLTPHMKIYAEKLLQVLYFTPE